MVIDRLMEQIQRMGNPSVVGLDPHTPYIPPHLIQDALKVYGPEEPFRVMAEAIWRFNKRLIDALRDIVPAVKPQIAFYEQYGAPGIECYRRTLAYAKAQNMLTIGDIKRGDIASTAEAYANAHLGKVKVGVAMHPVFDADFVTLNPYLGSDAIEPFCEACRLYDKGVFVLVRTSNPGAADIQELDTPSGKVYEAVGDLVIAWGARLIGEQGYSSIGAVVGATFPEQALRLRERMPHVFFLVPGYGAQGGTADGASACFNENGTGAIVNSSRGIIAAYQQPAYKEQYDEHAFDAAARASALAMRDDLRRFL